MSEIDPISREIIRNALSAAADQMSLALYRTAYSTIVRDCLDYSTSLCDGKGEMIAQGVTIPFHMGSVPAAMETLLQKFDDRDIEPGDVFIMNDPFDGGMHIPDIFIVKPVFWEGDRIAFAVSTAHHLDLGGRLPGSSACDNTEIFQDGLRIPWLKLYRPWRAGRSHPYPSARQREGAAHDSGRFACPGGSLQRGGERGSPVDPALRSADLRACGADLIAYTERLMRAEIASWPDSSHTFTDYMDSDGVDDTRVRLQVKVTVEGDTLTADFTGSDAQVRGALNCTRSFTVSVVALCVRCALREEVPNTAGMFKPLNIIAPPGTVANVVMPGASSMRGVTGFRLVDTMFGAMAGLLPERIPAAGEGGNTLVVIGGQRHDRSPYVYYELLSGTWGARPDRDGNDGLCNPANVASNIPIEQAESEVPGAHQPLRPGAGQRRRRQVPRRLGFGARVDPAVRGEPSGHSLGPQKALALWALRRQGGSRFGKRTAGRGRGGGAAGHDLHHHEGGQVLYHRQAGGGGWGNPLERDPEAVARDVRNDKVGLQAARQQYGVVLGEKGMEVDEEATAELRRHLGAQGGI